MQRTTLALCFVLGLGLFEQGLRAMEVDDEPECCVCAYQFDEDKHRPVMAYPCGHLDTCLECSKNIKKCPICRADVEKFVKAYGGPLQKPKKQTIEPSKKTSDMTKNKAQAKPMKFEFGVTENGKTPFKILGALAHDTLTAQYEMTETRYKKIAVDPEIATNDMERLAAFAAREVFILVDRSESMNTKDDQLLFDIHRQLELKFGIDHSTIQIERECLVKDKIC